MVYQIPSEKCIQLYLWQADVLLPGSVFQRMCGSSDNTNVSRHTACVLEPVFVVSQLLKPHTHLHTKTKKMGMFLFLIYYPANCHIKMSFLTHPGFCLLKKNSIGRYALLYNLTQSYSMCNASTFGVTQNPDFPLVYCREECISKWTSIVNEWQCNDPFRATHKELTGRAHTWHKVGIPLYISLLPAAKCCVKHRTKYTGHLWPCARDTVCTHERVRFKQHQNNNLFDY